VVIVAKQIEDMIEREMTFIEARLSMAGDYYCFYFSQFLELIDFLLPETAISDSQQLG
jgi:hypothetical protein